MLFRPSSQIRVEMSIFCRNRRESKDLRCVWSRLSYVLHNIPTYAYIPICSVLRTLPATWLRGFKRNQRETWQAHFCIFNTRFLMFYQLYSERYFCSKLFLVVGYHAWWRWEIKMIWRDVKPIILESSLDHLWCHFDALSPSGRLPLSLCLFCSSFLSWVLYVIPTYSPVLALLQCFDCIEYRCVFFCVQIVFSIFEKS